MAIIPLNLCFCDQDSDILKFTYFQSDVDGRIVLTLFISKSSYRNYLL
jgi:hypothetical protein